MKRAERRELVHRTILEFAESGEHRNWAAVRDRLYLLADRADVNMVFHSLEFRQQIDGICSRARSSKVPRE